MDADQGESDSLNVELVNSGRGEQVVSIEQHGFNCGVVDGSTGEDWEVLVLVPGVADCETASQVVGAIAISDEVGAWNESVSDLDNCVNSWSTEEELFSVFELNLDESLSEGNSSGGESVVEVLIEPEEEFLPYLPFGLLSLGGLESVEDMSTIPNTFSNGN